MRKPTLWITVVVFFITGIIQAQNSLPNSKRQSSKSYIYAISRENLREIHLKDEKIDENMLGQCVAEFITDTQKIPDLPSGNYVIVNAVENQLNYADHTVDDLYFKIIPSQEMMLCLYDSLGNIIEDAVVKSGSRTISYNKTTKTYNTRDVKHETVLEINNHGVFHYIEIERFFHHYYRGHKKNLFTTTWNNIKYSLNGTKQKYTGFVVFSKPRYKPGETVKMKAYFSENEGKPYNKPLDVKLQGGYNTFYIDTTLTNLKPYRPGMYEYQFKLTDSLNLKLDTYYTIELKTPSKRRNTITGYFNYEDYELKGINFSTTADKKEYAKEDSVKLKFKVTDENDMAVYGGRVNIKVYPQSINVSDIKGASSVFVPDTLWRHTVDMSETAEAEVVLPDSIFPVGASLHYRVACEYLSADNEKKSETKFLYRKADDYVLDFSLDKGMLTIKQLHKGQSQPVMAYLETNGENGELLAMDSVMLPHTLPLPWVATDITVRTKHTKDYYFLKNMQHQLGYSFYRRNDSIYLTVNNPANIPFWYTIRRNKKQIANGYTTNLNYSVKDKDGAGYAMQLSYLFGEEIKQIEEQLPFIQKNMTMDISTPTVVYPGQKADVVISLTDKKGKPVNNADITAYSFTSKFKNYAMPNVVVRGKSNHAKPFHITRYTSDENGIRSKSQMNWDRWKQEMALDTVEYYKFLYPESYYKYTMPSPGGNTCISPYIVIDGALQGINMLWIDGRLYYSRFAEQFNTYVFPIEPGSHTLRFRTYDRDITVRNILVQGGAKNIFSFNASKPHISVDGNMGENPVVIASAKLEKEKTGKLTDDEIRALTDQLITVDNNFGWLWLPNLSNPIDVPAYISSGHTTYYLNPTSKRRFNYHIKGYINQPVLVGPFPSRNYLNGQSNVASVFADGQFVTHIGIEGANHYTLYPGYQKIKSWPGWEGRFVKSYTPEVDFRQQPITTDFIEKHFKQRVLDVMVRSTGTVETKRTYVQPDLVCRLNVHLGKDKAGQDLRPVMIFIMPGKKEDISKYQLHYGGTRVFTHLPAGDMKVTLVFNDSVSCSKSICLRANGQNHLMFDSITYDARSERAETAFRIFNRNVKRELTRNPYATTPMTDSIVKASVQYEERFTNRAPGSSANGVVRDSQGEPLIGVSVLVKGTTNGAITDFDGHFELPGVTEGQELEFSYIGYMSKSVRYRQGYEYNVVLDEDFHSLDEVVVVGYGVQKRTALTGSISTVDLENQLQGRAAGMMIRGTGTIDGNASPLILVNGLPYEGSMESLDPGSITSINVLKDASATAIYGARAANGVVMIQTNASSIPQANGKEGEAFMMEQGNSMRRNFHDDAFWQPRLRTNQKGEATFQVTYPDDITSWNAYFIAVGNKKQADRKQLTIRSFKALTARLSTPHFAIRGDSLNAVGRIANHYGDSISVTRKIEADKSQSDELRISKSHIDYIPVRANLGDSLSIAYSLQMANGYFDGEQRSFPIFEKGMLQTYGEFKVINDSATHLFNVNPELGTVTVHAEASSLELFLREIDKIDSYPYMCNEQMASKIKVLLSKKRIANMFQKEFKEDKKIKNLISRLIKNRNPKGLWGWWNVSNTELWISHHVIGALLDAKDEGYDIKLSMPDLSYALEQELKNALTKLELIVPGRAPSASKELLERLINLKRMDAPIDYAGYFHQINAHLKSRTVNDKLTVMHAMSVIGLKDEIQMDSLMHSANKTMLGSLYWGKREDPDPYYFRFILPYENNVDNTLIAYRTLREMGGHEEELAKIRSYFFERRNGGSWRNTYESSRIIETIMPDMLTGGKDYAEVSMVVNGTRVTQFPYTDQFNSTKPVEIKKQGTAPVFTTVYQQNWNRSPEPESEKGFTVKSVFKETNNTVSNLTAGKVARLEIAVTLQGDAEYIQIEVPIPAGCSYDSKHREYSWKEMHREYFKDKVVIFCNKLAKGEHLFSLELIPRYTGRYTLNPAKAELMYFPTFYGNENLKSVVIE